MIVTGAMFKVQHWPGAGILLVLGLGSYCFWFLPAALLNNYRNADMKHWKWVYIVTFITFFIDTLGALFKIMHWPGAGWFLLSGITLPFVLFLPFFIYRSSREKNFPMINFLGIMFGLTFLGIFTSLLALNVSKNVLDQGFKITYDNLKSFAYYENPAEIHDDIQKQAEDIYSFIDNMNSKILVTADNNENIQNFKNYAPLKTNIMLSEQEVNKILFYGNDFQKGQVFILKDMLILYKKNLLSIPIKDEGLIMLINELINTEPFFNGKYDELWEDNEGFYMPYVPLVLSTLTRIKENVKLIDHEVQTELYLEQFSQNL